MTRAWTALEISSNIYFNLVTVLPSLATVLYKKVGYTHLMEKSFIILANTAYIFSMNEQGFNDLGLMHQIRQRGPIPGFGLS